MPLTRPTASVCCGLLLLAWAGTAEIPLAAQQSSTEAAAAPSDAQTDASPNGSDSPQKSSESPQETADPQTEPEPIRIPPPPPPRPDRGDIELQQYEVEIPIVFQPHPRMGPSFRQAIIDELHVIADRSIGPMWDLSIQAADWITPRSSEGITRLTSEQLKARQIENAYYRVMFEQVAAHSDGGFPAEPEQPLDDATRARLRTILDATDTDQQEAMIRDFIGSIAGNAVPDDKLDTASEVVSLYLTPPSLRLDKIFPVAVELDGTRYTVSSREWDRASELITPVRRRSTIDRRAVAVEIARVLAEVFRPLVQIESADPVSARIRTMASEFPAADPAYRQVNEGSMFIPLFRYLNRNRIVQKIQFLPWTYLTAEDVQRTRASCRVDTGVKTPLGAFRRRRMELRALRINPKLDASTLTLVPRRNHSRPLVGYLVAVYNDPVPPPEKSTADSAASDDESTEQERETPDVYRSDRLGQVTIPVDPTDPLLWIYVRSGSALLAKFPIVPGTEASMMVECPDDTIRLDVEGQIALLQSRLVDTIAKREMVKAMIRNRMKKDQWDKVDESVAELKALPGFDDFRKMVTAIQYPAERRAQARNDRISESRIKKLGSEVLKVASIHLDQKKIDDLIEEVMEQRPGGTAGVRKAPGQ